MPAPLAPPGALAYGIQLPIQSLTRSVREDWELDGTAEDLAAVARAADDAGCAFVSVCDHVAVPDDERTAHMSTTWFDTIATLAFVAAHTTRVRLLSSVYIPSYRHPLVAAKAFLTVDRLSGGRAIVGVGAGHLEAEFAALGVDFATRGARTDEAIDAMRAAFANPVHSFAGEHYRYDEVALSPRPVQERIPIWIGGSSRAALRRVAARGDGWIPQGTPRAQMQACVDYLRARLDELRPSAQLDLGYFPGSFYVGDPAWDTGPVTVTGSPERLAETLRGAHDFGCNVLHLHLRSRTRDELCDQLAAFGRDVAPLLGP